MDIIELDLSVRAYNCLKHHGINTVEQLCKMSMDDMIRVRNLGRRSLEEILIRMKERNLTFKGE